MSNPISKADFLLGRMLGMLSATTVVVVSGFAVATIFVFGNDYALYPPFATAAGAAVLLNGIMLFLAMVVSALTRRKATAIAVSIIIWLVFTAVANAGNLSEYIALKLGPWSTLPVMVLNPIDASQNWAMLGLHQDLNGATITGLMITELFQQDTTYVLAGILFSWVFVCFAGAFLLFRHQDVA
jgi:ABC-type transport system involved in multi-copper enzyme maturation permease subunit